MKPDIKQRWLEALRSGKYKQGTHSLSSNTGQYCCLGVLCDIHSKETGTPWVYGHYMELWASLPDEVQLWAGLHSCDPVAGDKALSVWNDATLVGFDGIADLIEEHL